MWEIIKPLGIFTIGSVSLVGLLGFVFKKYFEHYLQNRSDELKFTTQLLLNKKQISYSRLHEERGEIIKELYSRLLDYKLSIESYLMLLSIGGDEDKRKSALTNWWDKATKFESYYQKNKIFFSFAFCKLTDNLRDEIKTINHQISHYLNQHNLYELIKSNNSEKTEYVKMINKANNSISSNVDPLLSQLEEEFRTLLGVENK